MIPHVISKIDLLNVMKAEPEGSKQHELFQRIQRDVSGKSIVFRSDMKGQMAVTTKLVLDFSDHTNASLFMSREFLFKSAFTGLCQYAPQNATRFFVSKESLAGGNLQYILNKKADPELKRYLHYRSTTALEFGINRIRENKAVHVMVEKLTAKEVNNETFACINAFGKTEVEYSNPGFIRLRRKRLSDHWSRLFKRHCFHRCRADHLQCYFVGGQDQA